MEVLGTDGLCVVPLSPRLTFTCSCKVKELCQCIILIYRCAIGRSLDFREAKDCSIHLIANISGTVLKPLLISGVDVFIRKF